MEKSRVIIKTRFRAARSAKYRSLAAFAAAIDENRSTCTAWEAMGRDVVPPTEKLATICRVLDISADYLLGLTDEPRRTTPPPAAPAIIGNSNGGSNSISAGGGGDCPHRDAVVTTLREAINALAEQLRRNP